MHPARARASQDQGVRAALRRVIAAEDGGNEHAAATGDQAAAHDSSKHDDANKQACWWLASEAVGALRRTTQAAGWRAVRLELIAMPHATPPRALTDSEPVSIIAPDDAARTAAPRSIPASACRGATRSRA